MYIWLLRCITLYQRRKKDTSLKIIEFLDTCVFINNLLWQSSGISLFLRKYYIVISDNLVGSFLNVFFFSLAVILSELREKLRKKDWVTGKGIQKNLCEGYYFCDFTLSFQCLFVAFFVYSLPKKNLCEGYYFCDFTLSFQCLFVAFFVYSLPPPLPFAEWPLWRHVFLLWLVFCVMISWVNDQKYENLL